MPPIIPDINILYLLDIFAALAIITKYKSEYLVLSSNRYFSFFQISFYIFGVTTILHNIYDWTMGNRLENGEYITNIYRIVGVAILISVCSIYVVCYCKRYNFNFKQLCICIMYAGLLQSIFTLIMLLFPSAKRYFNNLFVLHVYGSLENSGISSWIFKERLYGFANVLYDGFGYGTGIIAGIAIWLMLDEKKVRIKYVLYVIILIMVPILNSITGFFIALIALFIKMLQIIKNRKINKNSFTYIILFFSSSIMGLLILSGKASAAVDRLLLNILAIFGKYNKVTSYSNLMRASYWTLPSRVIDRVIGTGHTVYTTDQFIHSDTGYTNMIWMVGILGSIWLYSTFLIPIYKEYKISKTDFQKGVLLFVMISFLFFEIKGIGVAINTGMPIILTLMYMSSIDMEGK